MDDFTLKPGNNELPMTAFVNETLALKSMQPDGMVDLMIIGQTSVYNGVHLPYFVRKPYSIDNSRRSTDHIDYIGESTQEPYIESVSKPDTDHWQSLNR